ncbi:MAG: hypothetical protein NC344_05795 [Bacteroidales bacterium]|nr:hypothetical protein [Bacteroidales bacterium]MCM1147332.1 hypothetical protein [Bacteroidales bacterium]MCM1206233.1 hypothetical protein [Bacillota bacterium]
MDIKLLKTATLAEALSEMSLGETAIAPKGYKPETVRKTCTELKNKGYLFSTTMRAGVQTITRLK